MNKIITKLKREKFNNNFYIDKEEIKKLINEIRKIIFPNFFEKIKDNEEKYYLNKINRIKRLLNNNIDNVPNKENKINEFIKTLPEVKRILEIDVETYIKSDPSATSYEEVILSYPGIYAIFVYRIAHILYKLKINNIPRIMTEYAHEKTGIDIHPGAEIGNYFFIDHGTGIVIGETTQIGNHVKIYQNVTLGAIAIDDAEMLKGKKRHPTIKNNVTIYSGACILGGKTIINDNVIIGCNSFITKSIEANMIIVNTANDYTIKNKKNN